VGRSPHRIRWPVRHRPYPCRYVSPEVTVIANSGLTESQASQGDRARIPTQTVLFAVTDSRAVFSKVPRTYHRLRISTEPFRHN
jgi:hypothetical protein